MQKQSKGTKSFNSFHCILLFVLIWPTPLDACCGKSSETTKDSQETTKASDDQTRPQQSALDSLPSKDQGSSKEDSGEHGHIGASAHAVTVSTDGREDLSTSLSSNNASSSSSSTMQQSTVTKELPKWTKTGKIILFRKGDQSDGGCSFKIISLDGKDQQTGKEKKICKDPANIPGECSWISTAGYGDKTLLVCKVVDKLACYRLEADGAWTEVDASKLPNPSANLKSTSSPKGLIIAGVNDPDNNASMAIGTLSKDGFKPGPDNDFVAKLFDHCVVYFNESLTYVIGGQDPAQHEHKAPLDTLWILDWTTGKWREGRKLPRPRMEHVCLLLFQPDRIAVIGGRENNETYRIPTKIFIYHVDTNSWSEGMSLKAQTDEIEVFSALYVDGKVTIMGGNNDSRHFWQYNGRGWVKLAYELETDAKNYLAFNVPTASLPTCEENQQPKEHGEEMKKIMIFSIEPNSIDVDILKIDAEDKIECDIPNPINEKFTEIFGGYADEKIIICGKIQGNSTKCFKFVDGGNFETISPPKDAGKGVKAVHTHKGLLKVGGQKTAFFNEYTMTELWAGGVWKDGPKFQKDFSLTHHCLIHFNETYTFVFGNHRYSRNDQGHKANALWFWRLDWTKNEWKDFYPAVDPLQDVMCMKDNETDKIIIAGGTVHHSDEPQRTIRVYDVNKNAWGLAHIELPLGPDQKALIKGTLIHADNNPAIIGGVGNERGIFRMDDTKKTWMKMNISLKRDVTTDSSLVLQVPVSYLGKVCRNVE